MAHFGQKLNLTREKIKEYTLKHFFANCFLTLISSNFLCSFKSITNDFINLYLTDIVFNWILDKLTIDLFLINQWKVIIYNVIIYLSKVYWTILTRLMWILSFSYHRIFTYKLFNHKLTNYYSIFYDMNMKELDVR